MLRIRLSGVLHRLVVKRPSGAFQSNENAHQKASLPYGERLNVFSHCGCAVHLNKYNPICVTIDSTTPAPIRYILASSPLMSAFVAKCGSVPSIRATRSFRSSVIVISHSFHFGVGIVYHAPLVAGSYISMDSPYQRIQHRNLSQPTLCTHTLHSPSTPAYPP